MFLFWGSSSVFVSIIPALLEVTRCQAPDETRMIEKQRSNDFQSWFYFHLCFLKIVCSIYWKYVWLRKDYFEWILLSALRHAFTTQKVFWWDSICCTNNMKSLDFFCFLFVWFVSFLHFLYCYLHAFEYKTKIGTDEAWPLLVAPFDLKFWTAGSKMCNRVSIKSEVMIKWIAGL